MIAQPAARGPDPRPLSQAGVSFHRFVERLSNEFSSEVQHKYSIMFLVCLPSPDWGRKNGWDSVCPHEHSATLHRMAWFVDSKCALRHAGKYSAETVASARSKTSKSTGEKWDENAKYDRYLWGTCAHITNARAHSHRSQGSPSFPPRRTRSCR
jgi:hypothetical protein